MMNYELAKFLVYGQGKFVCLLRVNCTVIEEFTKYEVKSTGVISTYIFAK